MASSFGAGFGAILLAAVLLGLAGLLGALLLGTVVYRRRGQELPRPLQVLAVAALAAALLVGGFGVAALYDEAPVGAVLFLGVVLLPVGAAGGVLRRTTALPPLSLLTTVAIAWSLPYVLGLVLFAAGVVVVPGVLGLPPAAPERLRFAWLGAGLGGVAAVVGTVALARALQPVSPGDRSSDG
jgi:hypothetical protein